MADFRSQPASAAELHKVFCESALYRDGHGGKHNVRHVVHPVRTATAAGFTG